MKEIIDKIKKGIKPEIKDISYLLSLEDFSPIFKIADRIRYESFGDIVDVRAILEFSNHCIRRCKYCGLNSNNKKIQRYRMDIDEIVDKAKTAYDAGYKTIVLQSGEDKYYSGKILGETVKRIKQSTKLSITMSCGELSRQDYKYIKDCGADRYLLKHETSDEKLYSYLHDCGTLKNRLDCLGVLKSLGYYTGSGFMIGLPFQTLDIIAKDILTLSSIPCDMAGIGPFISHDDTPLKGFENGSAELTKRAVAITRILLPKAHLPATTALGVINSKEKDNIFSCGANVIMRKVTPQKYEQFYNIYPSNIKVDDIYKDRENLENQIKKLGRIPI